MKKIALFIVALAIVLGTLPLQSALAETTKYEFTVVNYVNDTLYILLEDEDGTDFEMKVPRFDTKTKELPRGNYKYAYTICGFTYTGTLKLKGEKQWEILPCGMDYTKMRFNSHFADPITVTMYGPLELPEPEEQEFEVELGGNPIHDLLSGHYIISYEAACSPVGADPNTLFTEEIRVLKNGTTQVTMHSCEWHASPARTYAKPVPVKFKIINHASFPVILQIVGPEGDLLTINPGVNLFQLIYGTYKYGYFLDGNYHTGYMMVTKNGLGTLVLKPSHIFELPGTGTEDDGGE